ncbi:hypothetical protein Btru_045918 [Bulinus truncatus]|nr:hypothetical protein Btru_045918 [Bulinus truncatus]
MPTTPVPYVNPSTVTFYLDGCKQAKNFGIFNPFAQDILFKVDNAHPEKYKVSLTQGVVCSQQKIYIELSCTSNVITSADSLQVRFFKWSRPRHGQKPRAQQYIGYRVISLNISQSASERERTPSDHGSVSFSGRSDTSHFNDNPFIGSIKQHSSASSDFRGSSSNIEQVGIHKQVLTNIIVTILLLTMGFLCQYINEVWFCTNIMDEVKPQTLAVVFFTLACVMIIKLLTFR